MSGKYYIGHTQDLEDRIIRHNNGRERYTKGRGPWDLIYSEEYDTRSMAMKREKLFKKFKSHNYINKEFLGIKNSKLM